MKRVFLALVLVFSWSCQEKTSVSAVKEISGQVFGSTYSIKYLGGPEAKDLSSELDHFFKEFNREFSTYQEDSVVTSFNKAPVKKKIPVSTRFIDMLKLITSLHEKTEGAFDPTVGPVIRAWGFYKGKPGRPSESDLLKARSLMGMEHIKFSDKTLEVWKTLPGLSLDLNAFAPGWAADLIGDILRKKGVKDFMVDVGGEILVQGTKGDSPWVIGIEKPSQDLTHELQLAVKITDRSISTSGNYRQYFLESGERRSHIVDPRTGEPVRHSISSVTTLAQTAVEADAWGTALMVLGESGIELAERHNISVLLLKARAPGKFESIMSRGMNTYLGANKL